MSQFLNDLDATPQPSGILALQTVALPANANSMGDIFAGWLIGQMDMGGAVAAMEIAEGRVTTVATGSMVFLRPVPVGSQIRIYADVVEVGRSSIRTVIEVWLKPLRGRELLKVTEGEFTYVAIDESGRTRPIPK
jgi:acyl-CoA thioesterase YciA